MLSRLGGQDAGEVLTLQRAAYVTEAQAHADLHLPPLQQTLAEVAAELADRQVLALGLRDASGRLVAAVRAHSAADDPQVAEIGRLTVVPDRQGQRLGTRLLAAVEEQLPAIVTECGCSPASTAPAICACTRGSATGRAVGSRHQVATSSSTSRSSERCPANTRPVGVPGSRQRPVPQTHIPSPGLALDLMTGNALPSPRPRRINCHRGRSLGPGGRGRAGY